MRKVLFLLVAILFSVSFVFSQTNKSANINEGKPFIPADAIDPSQIRANQIVTGKTKIPSNAKVKKFPNSAAVTKPLKTPPPPVLATGYLAKEKGTEEVSDLFYFYLFTVLGFMLTITIGVIILFGNHRRKRYTRRQRVIQHKNNRLKDEACRGSRVTMDAHENHGPFVTH